MNAKENDKKELRLLKRIEKGFGLVHHQKSNTPILVSYNILIKRIKQLEEEK